jgi:glycosyltransferase involved in cell wall biosynthesis
MSESSSAATSTPSAESPAVPPAPLFTIVTVCLNSAAHIAGALESVLSQSCSDFEYVIADGASTDDTLAIIGRFEERFAGRLRLQSERDEGLYEAMNKALRLARGEYVLFLGADDRLAPGALEAVAQAVAREPGIGIVCGATKVVGPYGTWLEQPRSFATSRVPKRAPARHQSIFVRRELLVAAGGFDTKFRIAADYELYLRLHEAGAREVLIGDLLSEFALGGVSSSNALRTSQEYRDVHVAHGANPLAENLLAYKSAFAANVVAEFMAVRHRLGGGR